MKEGFLGFSYGFRPGRSQHKALDALSYTLVKKKVNYVLDADIQGFFDNLDKAWMIKFVEHRVADRRILRLIQKWLKAGVMEEGKWSDTETGTPQGSVISPLLAITSISTMCSISGWTSGARSMREGEVIVLRYADDIVLGFQWGTDADRFRKSLGEPAAGKFGLELAPGWDAPDRVREVRRTEPETKKGKVSRRPSTSLASRISAGRMGTDPICGAAHGRCTFACLKEACRRSSSSYGCACIDPVPQTGAWLRSVVQGVLQLLCCATGNLDSMGLFRERVLRYWGQALKRRSQRHRYAWVRKSSQALAAQWLPPTSCAPSLAP